MKQVTILFVLSVLTVALAQLQELTVSFFEDPSEYCFGRHEAGSFQKVGKNYYKIHYTKINWFRALMECSGDDSQLASINSTEEFDNIVNYLSDKGFKERLWVGGMDTESSGDFRWLANGDRIPSKYWDVGQPDNLNGNIYKEQCAHFWTEGTNGNYRFNNWNCYEKANFLCQKKPPIGAAIFIWP